MTEESFRKKIKEEEKEVTLQAEIEHQKKAKNRILGQVDTNVNVLLPNSVCLLH